MTLRIIVTVVVKSIAGVGNMDGNSLASGDIARMTIVYGDGSMAIMIRQKDGTFSYERRNRK